MNSYQKKFYSNLKEKYGVEKVHLQWYVYRGGDTGRHKNYKTKTCGDLTIIPHQNYCICGHKIKENCYMKLNNTDLSFAPEYLVLGNCCIKKYMPNKSRLCQRCGEPHKNRKDNFCGDCRIYLNTPIFLREWL